MEQPFFASINWKQLMSRQIAPPFKPIINRVDEAFYFDTEFTMKTPKGELLSNWRSIRDNWRVAWLKSNLVKWTFARIIKISQIFSLVYLFWSCLISDWERTNPNERRLYLMRDLNSSFISLLYGNFVIKIIIILFVTLIYSWNKFNFKAKCHKCSLCKSLIISVFLLAINM